MTPLSIRASSAPIEEPPFLSLYEDLFLLEQSLTKRVAALGNLISTLSEQGKDPATQFAVSVKLGKIKAEYFATSDKLSVVHNRCANAAQLIVKQQFWNEGRTTAERMEARSRSRWSDLQRLSTGPEARSTAEVSLPSQDPIPPFSSFLDNVDPVVYTPPSVNREEADQLDLDLAEAFKRALEIGREEAPSISDWDTGAIVLERGIHRSPSVDQFAQLCTPDSEDMLPKPEPTPKPSSPPDLVSEVKEQPHS